MTPARRPPGPPRSVNSGDTVKVRPGEPDARAGTLASREAKAALRAVESRLTPADVASGLLPDQAILDVVRSIALGTYDGATPAREAVAACRLALEYSCPKPALALDVRAAVIQIVDPWSEAEPVEWPPREPAPFAARQDFE